MSLYYSRVMLAFQNTEKKKKKEEMKPLEGKQAEALGLLEKIEKVVKHVKNHNTDKPGRKRESNTAGLVDKQKGKKYKTSNQDPDARRIEINDNNNVRIYTFVLTYLRIRY